MVYSGGLAGLALLQPQPVIRLRQAARRPDQQVESSRRERRAPPTRIAICSTISRPRSFTYVDSFESGPNALKNVGTPDKLLGLFAYGNMNAAMDKIAKRRNKLPPGAKTFVVDDYHAPDQPMLDEMTEAALRVLNKNRDGFVLLVEGAHIDKQSHADGRGPRDRRGH